jgi:stage III sporulation protein AB
MWKIFGSLLVIASMGMAGIKVASYYSRRTAELRSLQEALQMLDTEIVYAATPLPALLKKISQAGGGTTADIFRRAGEYLADNQGLTTAEAWNNALQETWPSTALTQEDYAILSAFGDLLGCSDRQEQHKNITLTSMHLQKEEEKARRDQERNVRLWQYGGFLMGISIVLLLL